VIVTVFQYVVSMNSKKFDLVAWNRCIARIIETIDHPTVLQALMDAVGTVVSYESWYVVFFRRDAPPIEVDYNYRDQVKERYAEGPYLLCPFYNAFMENIKPGCYTMRELAPADFKTGEFYQSYYGAFKKAEETGWLLPVDDETTAHVSLTRRGDNARYLPSEQRFLNQASDIVSAVMKRIWVRVRPELLSSERFSIDFHVRMTQAFRLFATSVLTDRESEITHLLLKGHSAKSIARLLGISPGTVRNHMKSIYGKLEISSQSELFGLFFETLSQAGGDITRDPLIFLHEKKDA